MSRSRRNGSAEPELPIQCSAWNVCDDFGVTTQRWVSLAEEPDLLEVAYSFDEEERQASFMQGDLIAALAPARRIQRLWPECFLVLMEGDQAIARAVSIPFSNIGEDRATLPDSGWDGVVVWAAEDALDRRKPTTLCVLEIAIDPRSRGLGISADALSALRRVGRSLGYESLVAPIRPPDKAKEPRVPMEQYVWRQRSDGLPADRWLRVHVRAGGVVDRIAPFSMVVVGTLEQWRTWTGLPFDEDGLIDVPGALVPVVASLDLGVATYTEPNIWVRHAVAPDHPADSAH